MNQEPDAGVLGADTEEWQQLPESEGADPDVGEVHEKVQTVADESGSQNTAEPAGDEPWDDHVGPVTVIGAQRVQPRHARRRDLRWVTMALGIALIVATGLALYFWLQLGSARGDTEPPEGADLSSQLEQANTRLAETEQSLREAQVRVIDAGTEARELREQLDAAVEASAEADDEIAEAAEQLGALSDALTAAQSEGEALASAVLGSVDPVDACVRAAARLAQDVEQIGRGQLAEQARETAAICAAAQDSLGPAVSQARGVLAD
jgi:archaellum component FlaC